MRKSTLPRQRAATLRVAIYLRVSTVKQLKGYGLNTQLDQCLSWLDYKIGKGKYTYEIYTDGAVSGKLANRPDLDQMNRDISAGLFDVVIFGKLDRIGRTMRNIHRWVYDTTEIPTIAGSTVRVATADNRIDSEDDQFGLQLALLAYLAEVEHTLILERTSSGREKKMADGGWAFGQAPYPFTLDGKGRDATPVGCEDWIKVVEKAISLIVDDDKNLAETVEELNRLGHKTKRSLPWTDANLSRVLMSTALLGYWMVRDPETSGAARDEEGNFLHGETHKIDLPQLFPLGRVKAMRAKLAKRAFKKTRADNFYLLSSRLIGMCGKHYIGTDKSTHGRSVVYRCTGSMKKHKNYVGCGCKEIQAPEMEKFVWDAIVVGLRDRDHIQNLVSEWVGQVPNRVAAYQERIARLEEQIEKKRKARKSKVLAALTLIEEDDDGELDMTMVDELKENLRSQESKLQEELDMTVEWLVEAEAEQQRAADILALAESIEPKLEDLTQQQKEDVMELFQVRVQVTENAGERRRSMSILEKWLQENDKLVPGPLTDEQWAHIEGVFPPPPVRGAHHYVSRRIVLDALHYKVRSGLQWTEVPKEVWPSGSSALKLMGSKMMMEGLYQKAIEALGVYGGDPIPSPVTLPGVDISMSLPDEDTLRSVTDRSSWMMGGEPPERIEERKAA